MKRIIIFVIIGLCLLAVGYLAQDKQASQQNSSKKEALVNFSEFTIKEVLATIYQTQLNWSPLENEPELKQNTYSNRYISFATYEPIEEFADEKDELLEKTTILQTETILNRIEFRFFYKNPKFSHALRIKDGELYKFVEGLRYSNAEMSEFIPDFGYIICYKPDSLCLCIDYAKGGWSPANFTTLDIVAIKKLNFISLNIESALYFRGGKIVKNLEYVYQDSTSNYPRFLQHYQENHLKDDFVLKDDTKVADILALTNAKNYTGKLIIQKSFLSSKWSEQKFLKIWGPNIGYQPNLKNLIPLPEK